MKNRFLVIILMDIIFAVGAHDQSTKQIVLFGDSCSDSGNMPLFGVRGSVYAGPEASYSNGPTWIVKVGNLWNTSVEASSRGGLNYAFVGAQTSIDSTANLASVVQPSSAPLAALPFATGSTFVPSMQTQLNEFLTQRKDVSKEAIIFQYGGVNNYLKNPSTPQQDGMLGATDLIANATMLQNAGFCNQVIIAAQNKTLIQMIPPADFLLFGNTLNTNLLQGLKDASLHPVVIEQNAFWQDMYSNLAFYGFTGAGGNALYSSEGVGIGPMSTLKGPNDTILWFDGVHFSERLQNLFAQYVYNTLEAPVYWGHLMLQPFALARSQNAVVRQELYPLSSLCVGSVYPFISASYVPRQTEPFTEGEKPSTCGWNGTVGLAYRCRKHLSFGIAEGYNMNYFTECDTLGNYNFHLHSWLTTLFSELLYKRGYLNVLFDIGAIRANINRGFSMGPQIWCARGCTHGIQYDLLLEGAWYFHQDDLVQVGPIATIEYQHVNINGYSEWNASYNDLQYKRQKSNSVVTGLGLEALLWGPTPSCFHGFSMELLATANEEWIRGRKPVYFRQQSLGDAAPYGEWPVYRKRSLFGSFGLNLSKAFTNNVIFHIGYRGNWGQNHMSEQNLTMNLSFTF